MDKLPRGWVNCHIEDIANSIQYGYTGKTIENGDIKYLRITDIQNNFVDWEQVPFVEINLKEADKYLLRENDIVFARTGATAGKSFLIENLNCNSVFASYLIRIVPRTDKILPKYLYSYFQSPEYWSHISGNVEGAAQPNFNGKKLARIPFPLPPLSEQIGIVSKLDALFSRIDKSIALLEENIKHTKGLMASVLEEVFGGGTISLSELCLINPKKSEIRGTEENTKVSFLPMADLNEFQIDFQVKQIKKLSEVYTGYTYFRNNDVLVAKVTPCFENGKAGIARNLQNSIGFGSSEYHVLRAKSKILPEWIYYSLMTARFREEGVNNMTGSSGLKRVPSKFIEEWKLKAPAIEEQKKIIEKIQVLDEKLKAIISAQQSKLTYLKALKSSLLDRAFKGEL